MAVKKVVEPTREEEVKDGVEVTVETEVTEGTNEVGVEESVNVESVEVEIEEPKEQPKEEPSVEVSEDTTVDTSKKPEGSVKIRMRVDHKCCIAMERYDLKEGKTYVVPENVKRILNNAGLLAPL